VALLAENLAGLVRHSAPVALGLLVLLGSGAAVGYALEAVMADGLRWENEVDP
jgi:hypothetical protein